MMNLREFAAKVGFHPETIRKVANQGKCGRKILGEWRFDETDIERITEWPCGKEQVSTISTFKSVASEYESLLEQANAN